MPESVLSGLRYRLILRVQIEDDGARFDPAAAPGVDSSCGLLGIPEHADLAGGHLSFDSPPGSGTRVTAEFPMVSSHSKSQTDPM